MLIFFYSPLSLKDTYSMGQCYTKNDSCENTKQKIQKQNGFSNIEEDKTSRTHKKALAKKSAAVLLAKHNGFPLDAFHEALTDQSIENSHEVAMCVALHPSCGVNLRACLNAYAAERMRGWGFKAEPGSDPRLVPGTMDLQPTPLSLAIRARRFDVMKSLLAVGSKATAINYIVKVKQVMHMGGQPELVTYDRSWSPIFMAAGNGATGADISLLIARGADPNIGDGYSTPLHEAVRTKNISALEALVQAKGIKLDGMNPNNWTPLREAVDCKSFTAVKMLLDRGASTESRDNHRGYSPLLAAVYSGDIVTAKYLIERGANVRAQQWENGQPGGCCIASPDGTNVLYVAAEKNLSELIPLLMAKGADKDGQTLAFAARRGNVTAVNVLLSHGMGVTNSALNAAVSGNNLNCIMTLCDHGADLSKVDFRHIDIANQRNAAVVAFLAAEGVTPGNAAPDDTCRLQLPYGWY